MSPREMILAGVAVFFGILWLHSLWRRFVLGGVSRGALKELKRLQPKH